MSDLGNTRRTSESLATAQTTRTSSASVVTRARELAKPRPPLTKVELHPDGYQRVRTIGATGRKGQKTRVELDATGIGEILRSVLAGRDELVRAEATLTGNPRVHARRVGLDHLEMASRLIATFLDGEPSDAEARSSKELTSRNVDECARLPVGTTVYTGRDHVKPHHVAALRAGVERRGYTLDAIGPFYFTIQPRVSLVPAIATCKPCGYRIERGKCGRCGTRAL